MRRKHAKEGVRHESLGSGAEVVLKQLNTKFLSIVGRGIDLVAVGTAKVHPEMYADFSKRRGPQSCPFITDNSNRSLQRSRTNRAGR